MRIRLQHVSRYTWDAPTAHGPHLIRLRPAPHARAEMLSYNLGVTPEATVRWQTDPWGNRIARATWASGTEAKELTVTVDAAFDVRPTNPFDFFVDDRCRTLPFAWPEEYLADLAPYRAMAPADPAVAAWIAELPWEGYTVDRLVALTAKAARDIQYIIRNEPGIQTPAETLRLRRGSCRDTAVLLVEALRARGLAARFVSGYLVQLADEGNIPDLARGVSSDVVDLHAWAEIYVPGAGWIGLDGTSGLLCGEGHIALAATVNPGLAAPIEGTAREAASGLEVRMTVERLGHEPRPRKPYTDAQWEAMVEAGATVDARLADAGVRLTTGGEPTWTSREHARRPEWSNEALGPTKWSQGVRLAHRLMERAGEGVLVLHRMGKHYPGESLPRWALDLLWRADGQPLWERSELQHLVEEGDPERLAAPRPREELDLLMGQAWELARRIAGELHVPPLLLAAREDPWAHIAQEQNLPDDIDPLAWDLDDGEERARLARVLQHGLGREVGVVLPIAPVQSGWSSVAWTFRRGHLFLVPGDSPIGLRLPLDRIGGAAPEAWAQDPTALTGPLPAVPVEPSMQVAGAAAHGSGGGAAPVAAIRARTALCVEPRGGVLHVFLPPLPTTDDFLRLVAAVERSVALLGLRVRIEGYPPPRDPRIHSMLVTPDPGVLEVNLPVCGSFAEYARWMEVASDAANRAGLCTEKFLLDGREAGSGGGNHITLGGPRTADSPFLVRPALLASLVRFFQHHPSLSYLFTGLFVGPTSQAPRVDEARHDSLRELEIALERLAQRGDTPLPWEVDRALRHLLVDVTGNTHRSEICMDKLYSPSGPAGRQGIVEFRAFEMPPHERMAAAQVLLLRAIAARFALDPSPRPLVRWGTQLHDRFMLPHELWRDLGDAVEELRRGGLPVEAEWFRPFLDYRFPIFGAMHADGISVELRAALEPWPVLGEEASASGVSRYVDSSLDRIQVRVSGLVPGRHVVAVNGLEVPLHATGCVNEWIAGVRFRAWQPPHCLHPEIGIHHPLRFDLIDTWGKRSLGACSYHVWHPEGRAFDEPPLTAFEAGARRHQRFTREGHLPWPAIPRPTRVDPETPYTLDLRRYPIDRDAR